MILIVVVLIAVIGLFCAGGWLVLFWAVSDSRKVERLDAPAICDELFDGRDQVVYAPHARHGGLPTAALVDGAVSHGYRFVSESGAMATRTVIFAKV